MKDQSEAHSEPKPTGWRGELFVFAASSRAELVEQLRNFDARLAQVAHTFADQADRCAMDATAQPPAASHRLAIIAEPGDDCAANVARALDHLRDPKRTRFNVANRVLYEQSDVYAGLRRTALLFPGFGAYHPRMVADLYQHFQSVHTWIDTLAPSARASIVENPLLFPPLGLISPTHRDEASFADTMGAVLAGNLAMHTVLAGLIGLKANAMVGHSYGENAMLIASGMVDDFRFVDDLVRRITEAMQRVYRREQREMSGGMMLAIPAAAYAALDLSALPAVYLALDNCPQQVVLYGPQAVMTTLETQVQRHGALCFRLPALDQPVHTPLFPVPRAELRQIYAGLAAVDARMPALYSCATAAPFPAHAQEICDLLVAQWREPVRFRATIERMYADGIRTFVEVGPGGRLTGFVRDILQHGTASGAKVLAVPSNLESRETLFQLQVCLAQLFVRGHDLDLHRLVADRRAREGETPRAGEAAGIVEPAASAPAVLALPADYAGRRRQQELVTLVLDNLAEILGLTETASIDPEQGFFDQGMGSIQAVELVMRLGSKLNRPLAPTLAFDHPTPQQLARHLAGWLTTSATSAAGERSRTTAGTVALRTAPAAENGIAIIGIGCRFPGGVDSPEAFWSLLCEGRDAITEVPAGRWPSDANAWLSGADEVARLRYGGFLEEIDGFDSPFFGITPREAETLDPQQRLLLEITWEALEHAAIDPRALAGTATGVFVGISHTDYAYRLTPAERLAISGYLATGNVHSTAAGRIAFTLGLHGPCLAVDTACSSSLVAVHLACQSLRLQESDVAIAAGVNLLVSPESSIFLSKATALSVDGRCKTFDAAANGYVRGEGCGVIVLKRLADAQAAGDNILAVVRGSAVNHDGRTSGLTVPSGPAQQAVIRRALAAAGVSPGAIAYVECHGTGTSLGDPIEVQALGQVFGEGEARPQPLLLGSVKTNFGHLEAAAGIAGLIKVVLQLQHQQMTPSLHFHTPNPKIDWAHLPVGVCTENRRWAETTGQGVMRRRAGGVSSFGISGTNAHVILEEAPSSVESSAGQGGLSPDRARKEAQKPVAHILTISARVPAALDELTARTLRALSAPHTATLAEFCYTSNVGRRHFEHRRAVVAQTAAEAIEELREPPAARQASAVTEGRPRRPLIAFLCSGQGSQYPGMGRTLMTQEPRFRAVIEACDAGLRPYLECSLIDLIYGENQGSKIDQTLFTQPALFAVEYALARLWQSWGIEPDFVMGHSIGEYVAACLAGVFSLDDALRLVAARGRLMQSLPTGGAMLAVMADPVQVERWLAAPAANARPTDLSIAAVNGPASTVLSGALDAIERVAARMAAAGVRSTRINVSHAFHSALMDPILDEFAGVAATVKYATPQIPIIANRSGQLAGEHTGEATAAGNLATPGYWVRHLRETVYFARGLQTLVAAGCTVLLEVGPKPVLLGMGQQCTTDPSLLWLASLQPPKEDRRQVLESLAALYMRGVEVDWHGYHRGGHAAAPSPRAVLPAYPFQHRRYWIDASPTLQGDPGGYLPATGAQAPAAAQSLVGSRLDLPGANGQVRFGRRLARAEVALLSTYRLFGKGAPAETLPGIALPPAALLTMLGDAGRALFAQTALRIGEFELHNSLYLEPSTAIMLHTVLTPVGDGGYRCAIYSQCEPADAAISAPWTLHAAATLAPAGAEGATHVPVPPAGQMMEIVPADFYATSRQLGFDYGSPFRVLRSLRVGPDQAAAHVQTPDVKMMAGTPGMAPILLLDGAFQALGALLFQLPSPALQVVTRIAAITLLGTLAADAQPQGLDVTVTLARNGSSPVAAITLCDRVTGVAVIRLDGIGFSDVAGALSNGLPPQSSGRSLPEALQRLVDADPVDHQSLVMRRIRKLMANTMGIARDQPVLEDLPFNQMGIDSLVALHLRNAVQMDYWVDIPLVRFITDLSVATLAAAIVEKVDVALQPAQEEWVEGEL